MPVSFTYWGSFTRSLLWWPLSKVGLLGRLCFRLNVFVNVFVNVFFRFFFRCFRFRFGFHSSLNEIFSTLMMWQAIFQIEPFSGNKLAHFPGNWARKGQIFQLMVGWWLYKVSEDLCRAAKKLQILPYILASPIKMKRGHGKEREAFMDTQDRPLWWGGQGIRSANSTLWNGTWH